MTPKQRLLNMLREGKADRLSWSPNLPYWWESQPDEVVNKGELEILKEMGADPLIRGRYPYKDRNWHDLHMFSVKTNNCEIKNENISDTERKVIYVTPAGNMEFTYTYAESADSWFLSNHPVHTKEDFETLKYFFENVELSPSFNGYLQVAGELGEEALLVAQLQPFAGKTPFQSMVEYWVGTEEIVYAIMDFPETVDETLEAMRRVSRKAVEIAADSPAEVFLTWEDTSTTNISPAYYEKYILPDIIEYSEILQAKGKIYLQHACGHLKDMMPHMAKSGVDFIESISPPPTGNIELWDARKLLPEEIGLIGGIEPTVLLNSTIEELEEYVIYLIKELKGSKFVVANSDSCPPGVSMEKLKLIGELTKKYGILE